MAVQKHARDVLFFDTFVRRRAAQAPYPPLSDLVPLWVQAAGANFPAKEFQKGTITCIVKDHELDAQEEVLTLLLEVSDKNAPNATYLNHANRSARHFAKAAPEGNGHSAHVMISTRQTTGQPNTYLTLIEAIPNVSSARIQSTLNTAIRSICKAQPGLFTYLGPGGGNKQLEYVPHVQLGGHPSERFRQDIEAGTINGLKLLAPVPNQALGQGGYLTFNGLSADIGVSKAIPQGQKWNTIFAGIHARRVAYPKARIFLQPESGGKSFHVDIDAQTGNIIGEAYVKSRRISPINPLLETSSADAIVPHFAALMKALLIGERT